MSTSITCDNCGASILTSDGDGAMWWIKVGWREDGLDDACSPSCAQALIHQLQERQAKIESAVENFEPSDA